MTNCLVFNLGHKGKLQLCHCGVLECSECRRHYDGKEDKQVLDEWTVEDVRKALIWYD